jgi:hypothetical protein
MKKHDQAPAQTIVDPAKVRHRLAPSREEPVWHHELVGARLVEAAATVRRMPMNIWPKQFGTAWPRFEAMTPGELQALKNELQQAGQLEAWEREQNRMRIPPSGAEIERCEQALGWIPRYLSHDRETAQAVGFWASKTFDFNEDEIPAFVRSGLREISRGLRRDRVPVRT